MKLQLLVIRLPGFVVPGRRRPLTRSERAAIRTVGVSCSRLIGLVGLLPASRLVLFIHRRHIRNVVHPAMPARRNGRRFRSTVIDHVTPVPLLVPVVFVAEFVFSDEFPAAPQSQPHAECIAAPPTEYFLEPWHNPFFQFRLSKKPCRRNPRHFFVTMPFWKGPVYPLPFARLLINQAGGESQSEG